MRGNESVLDERRVERGEEELESKTTTRTHRRRAVHRHRESVLSGLHDLLDNLGVITLIRKEEKKWGRSARRREKEEDRPDRRGHGLTSKVFSAPNDMTSAISVISQTAMIL